MYLIDSSLASINVIFASLNDSEAFRTALAFHATLQAAQTRLLRPEEDVTSSYLETRLLSCSALSQHWLKALILVSNVLVCGPGISASCRILLATLEMMERSLNIDKIYWGASSID